MQFIVSCVSCMRMAETALIVILSLLGGCGTTAVGVCVKHKTQLDKVNIRCKYEDSSCVCAVMHEETEIEQKVRSRIEIKMAQKEAEIKQREMERLVQLTEMESQLRDKHAEVERLFKLTEEVRDDYSKLKESISRAVFSNTQQQPHGLSSNVVNIYSSLPSPPPHTPPPPRRLSMYIDTDLCPEDDNDDDGAVYKLKSQTPNRGGTPQTFKRMLQDIVSNE